MTLVIPVPKLTSSASFGDFRPISVYSTIPFSTTKDQFAFRPTGSTTRALILFSLYYLHARLLREF